ncbi:MAG: response regulator [Bdellovibrionota bacterium]
MARKILLVEDNATNIAIMTEFLTDENFEILFAKDGEEAVAVAESGKPDLILMDINLPIMSGIDATKKIRSNPNTKDIPIIALTAGIMPDQKKQAMDAGCNDFHGKPIDFMLLIDLMNKYLK